MKDTKLVQLMKTFDSSEMKELEYFVRSPYYNRGRDLRPLFNELRSFYPDFEDEKLTPEFIYNRLYPGRKFNKSGASLLYTLSSGLMKLCREFLIITELNKDHYRRQYYLLNRLREKKLFREYEREYKSSLDHEDELKKGSPEDFLNKFYLKLSYSEFCIETGDAEKAFENILSLGDYPAVAALTLGYRNKDLRHTAGIYKFSQKEFLNDKLIEYLDSSSLLESLKTSGDEMFPYIQLNYLIHKMSSDTSDDESYFRLKEFIEKNLHMFGHTERYVLYSILISESVRKFHIRNDRESSMEQFNIYKKMCELDLMRYDSKSKIQVSNFRNVVKAAFDVDEFDWLENFVEKYAGELQDIHIENMTHYAYAYIHTGRRDFSKALESLIKVKYEFFLFKIDVRNLTLRLYYELGYVEQTYSMLDTMSHYVSATNDLTDEFKTNEENFIKYIRRLLKLKESPSKDEIEFLLKELSKNNNIASKKWLVGKFDELKSICK